MKLTHIKAFSLFASLVATWAGGVFGAAEYVKTISSGDMLRIAVEESPDLDGTYPVSGDGSIDFSYVGRVLVEGQTLEGITTHLKKVLEGSLFKKATVHVDVSEYVAGNILLLGAIGRPGAISMRGNEVITLLEAIIGAGGMTSRAAGEQVKIFRRRAGSSIEREVITVNVNRIMSDYDFGLDQYLSPRDIVVVPEMGQEDSFAEFLVLGEFGRPGFYPIAGSVNMIRAVTLAGGLSQQAQLESARILRPGSDGNYSVIPVDLARLFGSADMKMNVSIYPGDILFLPSASQASGGKVYFLGEVNTPGIYPLSVAGDTTLARTILQRVGLSKFANSSAVRIQRKSPDGTRQSLTFDVDKILKSGDFDRDIPLQDEDVIMVPGKILSLF